MKLNRFLLGNSLFFFILLTLSFEYYFLFVLPFSYFSLSFYFPPSSLTIIFRQQGVWRGKKGIWGQAPTSPFTATKAAPLLSALLIKIWLEESIPVCFSVRFESFGPVSLLLKVAALA